MVLHLTDCLLLCVLMHSRDASFSPQVQAFVYLLGGGLRPWSGLMHEMLAGIHSNTTNVATYIGPGNSHCGDEGGVFFTAVVCLEFRLSFVCCFGSTLHAVMQLCTSFHSDLSPQFLDLGVIPCSPMASCCINGSVTCSTVSPRCSLPSTVRPIAKA